VWVNETESLSNFYDQLIECIGTFSYYIKPRQPNLESALALFDPKCPDPAIRPKNFKEVSKSRLDQFWDSMKAKVLLKTNQILPFT